MVFIAKYRCNTIVLGMSSLKGFVEEKSIFTLVKENTRKYKSLCPESKTDFLKCKKHKSERKLDIFVYIKTSVTKKQTHKKTRRQATGWE